MFGFSVTFPYKQLVTLFEDVLSCLFMIFVFLTLACFTDEVISMFSKDAPSSTDQVESDEEQTPESSGVDENPNQRTVPSNSKKDQTKILDAELDSENTNSDQTCGSSQWGYSRRSNCGGVGDI